MSDKTAIKYSKLIDLYTVSSQTFRKHDQYEIQ